MDKTDFIRRIIEEGSLITLLPRPRRFGKTLNLSMLRYFFERTEGNVFRPLFNGMKIEQWKDFDKYQGKYPVIMITLKDCKGDTFEGMLELIGAEVQEEFLRHDYLLDDPALKPVRLAQFRSIMEGECSEMRLMKSLELLSTLLTDHWGISPLVLMDEYDTPVHVAYDKGFYDKMVGFMRNFMSTVFKDNTDIFRGVITCVLEAGNDSFFCGLNNRDVYNVFDHKMSTAFGFTQEEVDKVLKDYSMETIRKEVKEWYNGYLFGGIEIYNPWSILNCLKEGGAFTTYWSNRNSDELLYSLIVNGPKEIQKEIASLIEGETLQSAINNQQFLPDMLKISKNVWSFMLFSGYLKAFDSQSSIIWPREYTLSIPNKEMNNVLKSILYT